MRKIRNLKQLVECLSEVGDFSDTEITFGKHKGKRVIDVPLTYVAWARREVSLKKLDEISFISTSELLSARSCYSYYIHAVQKQIGVEIIIDFDSLPEDEKGLYLQFSKLMKTIVKSILLETKERSVEQTITRYCGDE